MSYENARAGSVPAVPAWRRYLESPRQSLGTLAGRVRRSGFVANVATLTAGTAIAQAAAMAASPLLTRLFDPADFGILGMFTTIVGIGVIIASWKYEVAVVLPEKDEDAINVLLLSVILAVLMAGLAAMTLGVAGDHILGWIGHEQIGALIWWIPIGFALGGVQHALAFWNTRKKTFKSLAASNITRSLVTAVAQLLAGVAQAGALGLLLGTISGGICSNIVMVWRSIDEIWRLLRQHASLARMRAMMRTYRDFPKFTLPRAFLNNTTQNFPVLAFAYFFDPVTAGYYFLVNRLLLFPTKLVGESIRRVFYQDAIQTYHRGGKVFHRLLVLTLIMGGISLAPAVILALFGPPLFGLVFGDAWTTGGVYAQWLSMWWVAMFMQAPCVVMIPVLRLQQQALIYEVIRAVFRIGAIVVGAWYDDPLLAVALFGIVGVVFGMAMMVYILFATRRADANPSYVPGT